MRGKETTADSQPEQTELNTDVDRYPDAKKALSRISNDLDFPTGQVGRLEVQFLANGEGVYRMWAPREDEPSEQGHLPAP